MSKTYAEGESMSEVISLSEKRAKKETETTKAEVNQDHFEIVRQKNEERKKRVDEERKKKNQAVLRSYRIK